MTCKETPFFSRSRKDIRDPPKPITHHGCLNPPARVIGPKKTNLPIPPVLMFPFILPIPVHISIMPNNAKSIENVLDVHREMRNLRVVRIDRQLQQIGIVKHGRPELQKVPNFFFPKSVCFSRTHERESRKERGSSNSHPSNPPMTKSRESCNTVP